jgi:hypothetical protein
LSVYQDSQWPLLVGTLSAALLTGILLRAGLVAVTAAIFVRQFLLASPITATLSAWYAPASVFAILVVWGLGGGGYYLHASHLHRYRRLQSGERAIGVFEASNKRPPLPSTGKKL